MLRRSNRLCKTNTTVEDNSCEVPNKRKRDYHPDDSDCEDDMSSGDEYSPVQSTKTKEYSALNLSESDSDNDVKNCDIIKSKPSQQSDTESEDDKMFQTNFDFTTILNPQSSTNAPKSDVKSQNVDTSKENNHHDNVNVAKVLSIGEGVDLGTVLDVADNTVEKKLKRDDNYTIPNMVEITVKLPNDIKCKKGQDMQNVLRRRMNAICKDTQVLIHKVNLLLWISYGNHLNRVLNSPEVMGSALSLVPSKNAYPPKQCDLSYLENYIKWFSKKIKILSKSSPLSEITALSLVENFSKCEAKTKYELIAMFISMLRSLGLNARLVINLNAISIKPTSEQLLGPLMDEDHAMPSGNKSTNIEMKQKTKAKSEYFNTKSNKSRTELKTSNQKKSISITNNKNNKNKKLNVFEKIDEIISSTDEEDNIFIKGKKRTKSKYFDKTLNKLQTDVKNKKYVSGNNKKKSKLDEKIDRRVLSSDEEGDTLIKSSTKVAEQKVKNDFWVEVFLEMEEKWFCVDVIGRRLHCIKEIYVSCIIVKV